MFTEGFGRFVCLDGSDTIACEADGFRFEARVEYDPRMGAPWKEHCGHGDVSEWTRRAKAPGERVLCCDRDAKRFYDFAGAVAKAKAEGWGGEGATPGERAADAAEKDFRVLKAWCDDEWCWCGVIVTAYRDDVELGSASVWGIEANYPDSDNSYLTETANELLPEALAEAKAQLAALCAA
jgi:hypothetical protein